MCVVDAWLCYQNTLETNELQEDFYLNLAEELIDNNYDGRVLRSDGVTPSSAGGFSPINTGGMPRDCYGIHVMSMRKTKKGTKGPKCHTVQLRCRICQKKTTLKCSECEDPIFPICSAKTGRDCFRKHFDKVHVE